MKICRTEGCENTAVSALGVDYAYCGMSRECENQTSYGNPPDDSDVTFWRTSCEGATD